MSNLQEVMQTLKQSMIDELYLEDVKIEDIADDDALFGDSGLGLDSIDAVELVVLVEKHFSVGFEDTEVAKKAFASVRTLAEYIIAEKA